MWRGVKRFDNTTTSVLHLAGGSGKLQRHFCAFERLASAELERQHGGKHEAQVQHIQQFVDRFRAKASKAKQVQSRIKKLERMQTKLLCMWTLTTEYSSAIRQSL